MILFELISLDIEYRLGVDKGLVCVGRKSELWANYKEMHLKIQVLILLT
jgi:hypothetical protein